MVFLAITPVGLNDALRTTVDSSTPIWCGADAISEDAYEALKVKNLSRFSYELGARDAEVLEDALDTIDQHHPGQVIWVEAALLAD